MQLTGAMLIGGAAGQGKGAKMRAVDPSNGNNLDPSFSGGTKAIPSVKQVWRSAQGCWRAWLSNSLRSGIA